VAPTPSVGADPAGEDAATATIEAEVDDGGGGGSWTDWLRRLGLPGLLLGCFLYGLAINLTPCVLPLLSIKVLGFVQQAHESRARTAVLGLAFGLGAMIFFVALGLLAAAGTNVLQYPAAVIALGAVVMALALSLLGVWTLQPPSAATSLDARIHQEGVLASFGKGMLAPVLGFACTGPFMAAAYGWAVQQPRGIAVVAFLVMGLGMAMPYVVLGFNPRWLSFLPKPGAWMITFERIMGFLLLAMVVWLINPLTTQIGAVGLQWTMVFLIGVAMACWIWGQEQFTMPDVQRYALRGTAVAVVLVAGGVVYGYVYPLGPAVARQKAVLEARYAGAGGDDWSSGVPWQRWSPDAVHAAVCAGKTVFVDFTAAYCTQCKVNKKRAIETAEVRGKMRALDVIPFQADFTIPDSAIAEELKRHGAAAVPLNLIYAPGKPDKPVVLPTALNRSVLLGTLEKTGPSRVLLAAAPGCDA
jgi:thiol:disulfide interchange protein DsbD